MDLIFLLLYVSKFFLKGLGILEMSDLKDIIKSGDLASIKLNKSRLNEINSISLVLKTLIIELIEKEIITLEDFITQLNKIYIEDGKSDINQLLRWL